MKKNSYLFVLIMIALILSPQTYPVFGNELNISSEAAILIDAETGQMLYGKNHEEARQLASTTKIMTAILAIEKGNIEDIVSISKRAAQTGEASLNLIAGEKITLENLLYGALLKSGNDACVAIAEHVSPTVEEFIGLMNLKADLLGCYNTNFMNTNGLPHSEHYSSALDLAMIARYALKNDKFAEIVSTPDITIYWEESHRIRKLKNTNKLLKTYPGATGIKTGTTIKAGQCLVASANKEGRTLIAVVLKSKNRFNDAKELFDYGFNNYYNKELIKKNQKLNIGYEYGIDIVAKTNLVVTFEKNEKLDITVKVDIDKSFSEKDFKKGDIIGSLTFFNNNTKVGYISITGGNSKNFPQNDYTKKSNWDSIRNKLFSR